MMTKQPKYVTEKLFAETLQEVKKKKKLAALGKAEFRAYHEGLAAQATHIGPYSEEGPTIAKVLAFISDGGYKLQGKQHEIYLGDPRKTAHRSYGRSFANRLAESASSEAAGASG